MSDLVEFLWARLDEDEQAARDALSGRWDAENGWGVHRREQRWRAAIKPHVGIVLEPVPADHFVRWNPARVLREVEAKRQIVRLIGILTERDDRAGGVFRLLATMTDRSDYVQSILRQMARPYADHPAFRPEWWSRPELLP